MLLFFVRSSPPIYSRDSGNEIFGSIVSPSAACGAASLRRVDPLRTERRLRSSCERRRVSGAAASGRRRSPAAAAARLQGTSPPLQRATIVRVCWSRRTAALLPSGGARGPETAMAAAASSAHSICPWRNTRMPSLRRPPLRTHTAAPLYVHADPFKTLIYRSSGSARAAVWFETSECEHDQKALNARLGKST